MSSTINIVAINDSAKLRLWRASCLDLLKGLEQSPIVECYHQGNKSGLKSTANPGLNHLEERVPEPGLSGVERLLVNRSEAIKVATEHWSYTQGSNKSPDSRLAPMSQESTKDRLENANLIIDFTGSLQEGDLKKWPRFGIWRFQPNLGEGSDWRPFMREFFSKSSVIQIKLYGRIFPNGPYKILREGFFSHREKSFHHLVDDILFQAAQWPAYALNCELNCELENGNNYLKNCEDFIPNIDTQHSKSPRVVNFGVKVLVKRSVEKLHSLFLHDQWAIGVIHGSIQELTANGLRDSKVTWLIEPASRNDFFADPFAVTVGDSIYILYEDMDHRRPVGRICYSKFSKELELLDSGVVFQRRYHISYPFLLQDGDSIYCLPETGGAERLSLFKAVDFPIKWEEISRISDNIRAVDPTIFEYGDLWWIAYTDGSIDENSALCLMYSDKLTGPWNFHAKNPVKMDVRSSRPAGALFFHGGDLYRPGQDCSRAYGYSVALNVITHLTPFEFKETTVGAIKPFSNGPYTKGLHTVCPVGDYTVVDSRTRLFVPTVFRRRLLGKIRSLIGLNLA